MKMTKGPVEYVLYQGLRNVRDPSDIGWREWSRHTELEAARKHARNLSIARVDKAQTVYVKGINERTSD
jgi:hypothetical protein